MPSLDQFPQRSLGSLEREAHLAISQLLMTIARQILRIDQLEEEMDHIKLNLAHLHRRQAPNGTKPARHKPKKEKTPE